MSNVISSEGRIVLTAGVNEVNGLTGNDTLVIQGASANYIIEALGGGSYRLIDISGYNPSGVADAITINGIGRIEFNDTSSSPEQLASRSFADDGTNVLDASTDTNANGVVFNGYTGDDIITGSDSSRDMAVFSGMASDYWVSNVNGQLRIRDLRAGAPDGVDTIVDVEYLRFADKVVAVRDSGFNDRGEWIGGAQDERSVDSATSMLFVGGGGNDRIKGSANDVVVFSGNKSDYVITRNSDGSHSVNDRRDFSPDGVDVVYGVKTFRFNDGTYNSESAGFTSSDFITSERYGGAGADKLIGTTTSGNDRFEGNAGNDTLDGKGGHDYLYGGAGDDKIYGGLGSDFIEGGLGKDTLDGGTGVDTLSYATSNAGVTVNLATAKVSGGHATGDKIAKTFENIQGSAFADNLTGTGGVNRIDAGAGDDTVTGGAGADYLDGGEGTDTLSYATSNLGVTVNLADSEAFGGDAGTLNAMDQIAGFENVIGSASHDNITGDLNQNVLIGGSGNDQLGGLLGNDFLYGGVGNDILIGGEGSDVLDGGVGVDAASYRAAATGVTIDLRQRVQSGGEAAGDQLIGIEIVEGCLRERLAT